ncbi:MAG: hypothetical protein KH347_08730 [Acetobacter sp.]|nr:hypothetical protein [Acetobacter sp.]
MNKDSKKIGKNIALAALSQIPVVSAFSKFIEDFVQDGWQERIYLWKEEVVKRLAQLDKEIEQKIRETSNFASILVTAQRGALEDMEEDKVALYANAFINAIKNERMEDTKKHLFLNMLREFTSAHLKILHLFYDEPSTERFMTLHVVSNHVKIYEENNEDFIHSLLSDLMKKGLLTEHPCGFSDGITYSINKPASSALGCEFLAFISEQEKTND